MTVKTLVELYEEHSGKVSDKWSLYLREYDRIFSTFRQRDLRLLEIGIQNGGSLDIWRNYFPRAVCLVGCDINPDCSKLEYDDPRISVVVGDANLPETEARILAISETFDAVIDDGSHTSSDIVKCFTRYFPHLAEGGVFVVEDLHCSYWSEFEGGLFDPYSSITFFKHLADIVNHQHWGVDRRRTDLLSGIFARYGCSLDEQSLSQVASVEFVNSICVVRKQSSSDGELGRRRVAGSDASVLPEIRSLAGAGPLEPTQTDNPWSAQESPPGEELIRRWQDIDRLERSLRRVEQSLEERERTIVTVEHDLKERDVAIRARDRALAATDLRLLESGDQIRSLEDSTSWRLTAPIRAVGSLSVRPRALWREFEQSSRARGGGGAAIKHALRRLSGTKAQEGGGGAIADDYTAWILANDRQPDPPSKGYEFPDSPGHHAVSQESPLVSVLMPTFNTRPDHLEAAIGSVLSQTWPNWELCIVDDASSLAHVREICSRHAGSDGRIRFQAQEVNGRIVVATNAAIAMASGDFVCFLDHDDMLHPDAIERLVDAIRGHPDADLIYTDEDKLDDAGRRCAPFFKPDWSPHLALSQGYLGHLVCYRKSLIDQVGGLRPNTDGAQDYDLWLRASIEARGIIHIPRILYHWRMHDDSTAKRAGAKPYAHDAGMLAVSDYVARRYPDSRMAIEAGEHVFTYRARFDLPRDCRVSIIIPTRDRVDLLKGCIDSIRGRSSWQEFEIIIVDNGSIEAESIRYFEALTKGDRRIQVMREDCAFNWSFLNNLGARKATGDVLLFLNNDTEVVSPDWLQCLAGYARLPDVGTVGGLLLFEDGTIQHSGVVVGMGGWADHVFRLMPPIHHVGPFVSPVLTRDVLAVTGACVAIERMKFESLGRFDEAFTICGSDVAMGLEAHRAGYYNVMCAEARMIHFESKTRTPAIPENDFKQSDLKYRPYRTDAVDPYFNPNLSLDSPHPTLRPVAQIVSTTDA